MNLDNILEIDKFGSLEWDEPVHTKDGWNVKGKLWDERAKTHLEKQVIGKSRDLAITELKNWAYRIATE